MNILVTGAAGFIGFHLCDKILKSTNFKVTFHTPLKVSKNGKKKTSLQIMTEVNLIIEKWIRKNPGQWLWLHRRW